MISNIESTQQFLKYVPPIHQPLYVLLMGYERIWFHWNIAAYALINGEVLRKTIRYCIVEMPGLVIGKVDNHVRDKRPRAGQKLCSNASVQTIN